MKGLFGLMVLLTMAYASFPNPVDGQSNKFIVVSPWYTTAAGPNSTGSITAGMVDILADLIKSTTIGFTLQKPASIYYS